MRETAEIPLTPEPKPAAIRISLVAKSLASGCLGLVFMMFFQCSIPAMSFFNYSSMASAFLNELKQRRQLRVNRL